MLAVRLEPAINKVVVVGRHFVAKLGLGVGLAVAVLCRIPDIEAVLPLHVVAEVPLAHIALEIFVVDHLGDYGRLRRQVNLVHNGPCFVRVEAGHNGGARRSAYRLRDIGVLEHEAAVRERVQVRHIHVVRAVAGERIGTLLVAHYENDIGRISHTYTSR